MAEIRCGELSRVYNIDVGRSGVYLIPEEVQHIGWMAFSGCKTVKKVGIPKTVKDISSYAFQKCESLEKVVISEGIECIGDFAFWNCLNLKEVNIPSSIISTGVGIFDCCKSLELITIPNHIPISVTKSWFNYLTNQDCDILYQEKKYRVEDILLYY